MVIFYTLVHIIYRRLPGFPPANVSNRVLKYIHENVWCIDLNKLNPNGVAHPAFCMLGKHWHSLQPTPMVRRDHTLYTLKSDPDSSDYHIECRKLPIACSVSVRTRPNQAYNTITILQWNKLQDVLTTTGSVELMALQVLTIALAPSTHGWSKLSRRGVQKFVTVYDS